MACWVVLRPIENNTVPNRIRKDFCEMIHMPCENSQSAKHLTQVHFYDLLTHSFVEYKKSHEMVHALSEVTNGRIL